MRQFEVLREKTGHYSAQAEHLATPIMPAMAVARGSTKGLRGTEERLVTLSMSSRAAIVAVEGRTVGLSLLEGSPNLPDTA